jgi:hypothetical protein
MRPVFSDDRLGGADAAWLHMEEPANPMVVNSLLELGGRLDFGLFQGIVERMVATAPRFRARVVEAPLGLGVPHWEPDPNFELSRHVERVVIDEGEAALRSFIGDRLGTQLELSRPLWRFSVIERDHANTIVLCRIHHSIADGFALMGLLLSLCDEHAPARVAEVTHGFTPGSLPGQAASITRLVTLLPDPKTQLKRPLSGDKRVAWTRPIPLGEVKAVAHELSATVNDVLVAVVTGGLRSFLRSRGDVVEQVRAMVPVNLRALSGSTNGLGNRFGLVILGLPVGLGDPIARVFETSRRMARLKSSPEAVVTLAVLRAMGWAPRAVEDLGVAFFGSKCSLVLTNVPGPRERLHLCGVPLDRLMFWVPQSARMGLGVSIFSYANEVTIGVLSDAAVLPEPRVLVDALEAELAQLRAHTLKSAARVSTNL